MQWVPVLNPIIPDFLYGYPKPSGPQPQAVCNLISLLFYILLSKQIGCPQMLLPAHFLSHCSLLLLLAMCARPTSLIASCVGEPWRSNSNALISTETSSSAPLPFLAPNHLTLIFICVLFSSPFSTNKSYVFLLCVPPISKHRIWGLKRSSIWTSKLSWTAWS